MPWSGGTYTHYAYTAVSGQTVSSSDFNSMMDDFQGGLNNCITVDGNATITANIPFGTNKITGLGDPTSAQDGATKAYVDAATAGTINSIDDGDSPYTLLAADQNKLVLIDAENASVTVNLLAAATAGDGFRVSFKRVGGASNTITIDGSGAETIDGAANITIDNDDDVVTLRCDGTGWQIDGGDRSASLTADVTGTLPVANGGSGRATHTAYAVLCGGTTTTGAQQSIASVGTSGQVLTSNGAGALPTMQDIVLGPVEHSSSPASTASGTSVTFGSIPAGVDSFRLGFSGVSFDGSANLRIRLGDSGGVETSGYISRWFENGNDGADTDGLEVERAADGDLVSGVIIFERVTGNQWVWTGTMTIANNDTKAFAGSKTLSGELTQVEVTPASAANFDAGTISMRYESAS